MSFPMVLLIVAAVVFGGNVLLVGLPGALLLSVASVLVKPLGWTGVNDLGDRAWPLALLATTAWGAGLLPLWWLVRHLPGPQAQWFLWAGWSGWGLLSGAGLLAYCHFKAKPPGSGHSPLHQNE